MSKNFIAMCPWAEPWSLQGTMVLQLVGHIFKRYGIQFHVYADDTQVYISFHLDDQEETVQKLESCLQEVHLWVDQKLPKA